MRNIPKKNLVYLFVAFALLFVDSTDAFALTEEKNILKSK